VTRPAFLLLALMLAALCGCGEKKPEPKRYPMQGEVKAIDASTKTAQIAAGKIGDWMDAMTMDYVVKPDAEFQKLHVGDKIEATVVVEDPKYYVTDVKVLFPASPPAK
jgi:Cu/Ag efflux protein CusF